MRFFGGLSVEETAAALNVSHANRAARLEPRQGVAQARDDPGAV